ncbi:MAG TPA: hypothetical protein VD813_06575 [Pseudonocardia sp.]|nr:hypothetical protein [Pseudonocardia sp.]
MSTPLRRGAAVVAVTGGALSLVGAAAPDPESLEVLPSAADDAVTALGLSAPPEAEEPVVAAVAAPEVAPVAEPLIADAATLLQPAQLAMAAADQAAEVQRAARERAEQERIARERAARETAAAEPAPVGPAAAGSSCGLDTSVLGAVKPWVNDAAEFLGCRFGEPRMIGVASRGNASDHPSGLALDFMVDRATGDALAECALANKEALGITYVIWEQRINHGSGWEPMEDRGSVTANHYDHVHISFRSSAGSGNTVAC